MHKENGKRISSKQLSEAGKKAYKEGSTIASDSLLVGVDIEPQKVSRGAVDDMDKIDMPEVNTNPPKDSD